MISVHENFINYFPLFLSFSPHDFLLPGFNLAFFFSSHFLWTIPRDSCRLRIRLSSFKENLRSFFFPLDEIHGHCPSSTALSQSYLSFSRLRKTWGLISFEAEPVATSVPRAMLILFLLFPPLFSSKATFLIDYLWLTFLFDRQHFAIMARNTISLSLDFLLELTLRLKILYPGRPPKPEFNFLTLRNALWNKWLQSLACFESSLVLKFDLKFLKIFEILWCFKEYLL